MPSSCNGAVSWLSLDAPLLCRSLRDNNLGGFIPEKWTGLSRTCRMDLSNNPFVCNLPPQGALLAKVSIADGILQDDACRNV